MITALAQLDSSLAAKLSSGLDTNSFYAFPLRSESGLRSRLWQQIISIFEEIPLNNEFDELAEANNNKLVVLK